MKIQCNVCETAEAKVLCCADEAALCHVCDDKVHAANKLASKHQRVSLSHSSSNMPKCDICQVLILYTILFFFSFLFMFFFLLFLMICVIFFYDDLNFGFGFKFVFEFWCWFYICICFYLYDNLLLLFLISGREFC